LTLPQLTMLNHAAWADHENGTRRYEAKKKWEEQRDIDDPVLPDYGGRRLSEVKDNPELLERYLSSDWSGQ